jgi:hypothetical protein
MQPTTLNSTADVPSAYGQHFVTGLARCITTRALDVINGVVGAIADRTLSQAKHALGINLDGLTSVGTGPAPPSSHGSTGPAPPLESPATTGGAPDRANHLRDALVDLLIEAQEARRPQGGRATGKADGDRPRTGAPLGSTSATTSAPSDGGTQVAALTAQVKALQECVATLRKTKRKRDPSADSSGSDTEVPKGTPPAAAFLVTPTQDTEFCAWLGLVRKTPVTEDTPWAEWWPRVAARRKGTWWQALALAKKVPGSNLSSAAKDACLLALWQGWQQQRPALPTKAKGGAKTARSA